MPCPCAGHFFSRLPVNLLCSPPECPAKPPRKIPGFTYLFIAAVRRPCLPVLPSRIACLSYCRNGFRLPLFVIFTMCVTWRLGGFSCFSQRYSLTFYCCS